MITINSANSVNVEYQKWLQTQLKILNSLPKRYCLKASFERDWKKFRQAGIDFSRKKEELFLSLFQSIATEFKAELLYWEFYSDIVRSGTAMLVNPCYRTTLELRILNDRINCCYINYRDLVDLAYLTYPSLWDWNVDLPKSFKNHVDENIKFPIIYRQIIRTRLDLEKIIQKAKELNET